MALILLRARRAVDSDRQKHDTMKRLWGVGIMRLTRPGTWSSVALTRRMGQGALRPATQLAPNALSSICVGAACSLTAARPTEHKDHSASG